ncbi:MAG: transposase [Acidobacteria bacterium]|nr:transposase [Acidobacteriota bacterium]
MKKALDKTPSFVAEFELEVSSKGLSKLEKIKNAYRQIYNATLGELKRNLQKARNSTDWQKARLLKKGSPQRQEAFAIIRKNFFLSQSQGQKIAAQFRQGHLEELTNSRVVQQVAKRAWRAIEKLMYGKSKKVRFRKYDEFMSFEGNDNITGVLVNISTGTVKVGNSFFLYKIDLENPYHINALKHRVKFSRIIKRVIKGKSRWYVQMVLEGKPYKNPKHITQSGKIVGLDLGPRTIAVSTKEESFQQEFCPELKKKQKEIRQLQRKLERSRRKNNPENYDETGRIKKGKKVWKTTNNYNKLRIELKDINRKQASHRKSLQGKLANKIIRLGNIINTEKVSYKAWQKLYGKSISYQAPSAFEGTLTRKAETLGGGTNKINTYQTALSQHCICGEREKKTLSERTHKCKKCGFIAPRDELSAYLALHTSLIEGKWKTDYKAASSNIQGHRTLSLSQESKPELSALYQARTTEQQSATDGLAIQKRNSSCVRALRTEDH